MSCNPGLRPFSFLFYPSAYLTSSLDSIVEPGLADRDLPILDLVPNFSVDEMDS